MIKEVKFLEGYTAYAHLTTPRVANPTYNIPPRYTLELILTDDKEANKLIKAGFNVKKVDELLAKKGSGLEKLLGKHKVTCYKNAEYVDKATNELKKTRPPELKDSKNNLIAKLTVEGQEVGVGNGSKVRVAYSESRSKDGKKVRVALLGVQILSLVPYTLNSGVAFDTVDGGFVSEGDSISFPADASDKFFDAEASTTNPWD